jgi:hypothetical protein
MTVTSDAPLVGPCAPWAVEADIEDCSPCAGKEIDPGVIASAIDAASFILYRATAMQFSGTCTETVRPCCTSCCDDGLWWHRFGIAVVPHLIDGNWYNCRTPSCDSKCLRWECNQRIPKVDLHRYPVTEITAIKIDGVPLATSAYRIDDHRYVTRTDGDPWPSEQNLLDPDTEVGTWSIEYEYGYPIPDIANKAAVELACHLALDCVGDGECRLPTRATSVTRRGVTWNLVDVQRAVDRGQTGLYFVDLFIRSVNPHGLTLPPRVWSPDFSDPPAVLG